MAFVPIAGTLWVLLPLVDGSAFAVLEGECGLDATGTCARSPNFPKVYGSSSCTLEVQSGFLHATQFDTEADKDVLEIGNVSDSNGRYYGYSYSDPSSTAFSGTVGPYSLEVSDGDSLIWMPNSDVKHFGWEVCWSDSAFSATTTTASALCPDIQDFIYNRDGIYTGDTFQVVSGSCTVSSSGYCVRSPNYPQVYDDSDCCTIEAPAGNLSFTNFHVESFYDQLFVANRDVLMDFFSEFPTFALEGDRIAWSSDNMIHTGGWGDVYGPPAVPLSEITMVVGNCNVSGNCVSSSNFPSSYEANERCEFQVMAGSVYATAFGTEMHFDHLYIDGTAYHGTWGPWGHVVASGAEFLWDADASVQAGGWRVCVLSEDLPATTTDVMVTNVTVLEGECTMTSISCVASPGYPGNYSHDGSCTHCDARRALSPR